MLSSNLQLPQKRVEIPALTGLRFVAAFAVFISHGLLMVMPMTGWGGPAWYNFLSCASCEGMTLFFVLSGFVIHYNYSASIKENPTRGIYNFFVARFARLYPLFLVGIAFDLIHKYGYSNLPVDFREALPFYLTLTQSWFYIPLGTNALIYQFGHISSVSWSVSTEWFFYVTYPVICFVIAKLYRPSNIFKTFLGLCLVGYLIVATLMVYESSINNFATQTFGPLADETKGFQDSFYRWLIYFSPYTRVIEFSLGCFTAAMFIRLSDIQPSSKEIKWSIGLLIFAILGIGFNHYFGFSQNPWANSFFFSLFVRKLSFCFGSAPFIAMLIFYCARYNTTFSRFFTKPALLFGGEVSYSLYLFHTAILQTFAREAAGISPSTHLKVYFADLSRLTLAFIAALGLAYIFYRIVEVPARRYIRKTFSIPNKIDELKLTPVPLEDVSR